MRISDWSSDVCSSDLNKVGKRYDGGLETIDLYDIDYDALLTYDPSGPFDEESQKQLGIYVQDQIRFFDRVSVVLGARRDRVSGSIDRKSVVWGKSWTVRVDHGGRRIIKKKKQI